MFAEVSVKNNLNKKRRKEPHNNNFEGFRTAIFLIFLQVLSGWNCSDLSTTQPTNGNRLGLTDWQQVLVTQLNDSIQPIEEEPLGLQDNQLSALDYLRNARIVGLGAATHGTKEFFQMKHRVFKYLVETHGFKAFGFEADFAESLYIDHYITTGEGDLKELMNTKMHFWTWKTEEVRALLEWMRQYNAGKPRAQMVRYFGIDCQFTTYQDEWIYQYLESVSPALLESARPVINSITSLEKDDYNTMSKNESDDLLDRLQQLYEDIARKEAEFVAVSGLEQFEVLKQLVRNLSQSHIVTRNSSWNISDINYKDTFMAENAIWVANLLGTHEKIALWAHNAHVANDRNYGSDGSMGMHLKNTLGNDYQVVGFSFSKGGFNAIPRSAILSGYGDLTTFNITLSPLEGSINFIFHYAQYDQFIFVLRDMWKNSELKNWLSDSQIMLSIGSVYAGNPKVYYRKVELTRAYDVMIQFDVTRSADILE
jgi:erythromycin esterase